MDNPNIKPYVAKYTDSRGVVVKTVGVDTVNHRVIYMRPGYPHPCATPRELWEQKFKAVKA